MAHRFGKTKENSGKAQGNTFQTLKVFSNDTESKYFTIILIKSN